MGQVMISGVAPQMNVPIALPPIGTALNDMTWEQIRDISDAGKASNYFVVGDTKNITLDGVSYPVQIIGFNHDTKTDGGTAGITFQLVDCLNTTYPMNSSNTNVGGWKSSAMRTRMDTFFSQLPSDLQSAIKAVNKLVSVGNNTSTIETVSDKLFLLSEVEIMGSNYYSFAGEGSQYAYYQASNSKVKKVNGSANAWWGRSPVNDSGETYFCSINSEGRQSIGEASNRYGVSFAFCV